MDLVWSVGDDGESVKLVDEAVIEAQTQGSDDRCRASTRSGSNWYLLCQICGSSQQPYQEGNTAIYAHARLASIIRKSGVDIEELVRTKLRHCFTLLGMQWLGKI